MPQIWPSALKLFLGILEKLGSKEIAHILCGAMEGEVSCDSGNLQSADPHPWALYPAPLLLCFVNGFT